MQDLLFPLFSYYLDESGPDIVILRRQDDSFVAALSVRGATKEGIIETAKEHYLGASRSISPSPYTGQIHARSVARTPFRTVSEGAFSEVRQ